ncbi:MAG: hypothetical protein WBD20_19000 [Pirellulaceae bacterium]
MNIDKTVAQRAMMYQLVAGKRHDFAYSQRGNVTISSNLRN